MTMENLINNKVSVIFQTGLMAYSGIIATTLYIKGLKIVDKNFDFELTYEVKARLDYFLLYATYTTEENGKIHKGQYYWIGLFQTQEEAERAAKDFDQSILPQPHTRTRAPLIYYKNPRELSVPIDCLRIMPVKVTSF
jgi:hypothetical protein